MANFICAISANIGAGKTTLLNKLRKLGYTVVVEDVENWTYLKQFYDKTPFSENQHIAVLLQLQILQSRFRQMKFIKNSNITAKDDVIFIERSTLDSLYVFAKNALEHENMTKIDYELLEGFTQDFGIFPNYTLFLQCSPEICISRLFNRDRNAEKNIS